MSLTYVPMHDLPPEAAQWLILAWLLLVGAAVGSFLNVVIYRLPAGLNIAWPGSFCPLCHHPIRWYDNIPVLGWVLLQGRCRDCRAPIAVRYPLVEAATSLLFVVVAIHEIFHDAANLPARVAGPAASGQPLMPLTEIIVIYGYHLLLLCTLLAAGLIAYDAKRQPLRLFVPMFLVGLLAPAWFPWLHPVPAWPNLATGRFAGLLDSAAGLAAGLLLGGLATYAGRSKRGETAATPLTSAASDLLGGAVCVGIVLGWQAACALTVGATVLYHGLRLASRAQPKVGRLPAVAWLGLATLTWIVYWTRIPSWLRGG
jgi:prepilin signal peptidase PulO-like enzyme (type II secretory pathway)